MGLPKVRSPGSGLVVPGGILLIPNLSSLRAERISYDRTPDVEPSERVVLQTNPALHLRTLARHPFLQAILEIHHLNQVIDAQEITINHRTCVVPKGNQCI